LRLDDETKTFCAWCTPVRYTIHEVSKAGELWSSPESGEGNPREIRQAVMGGYIIGNARWAEDDAGTVLYGITASGREGALLPRSSFEAGKQRGVS